MKLKKYIICMLISAFVFNFTNINVYAAEVLAAQEQIDQKEEVTNTNVATGAALEVTNTDIATGAALEVLNAVDKVEIVEEVEVAKGTAIEKEVKAVKDVKAVKEVKATKQVKKEIKKYTASELRLMSAIIYCEANSEKYNGKLAVGIVVMNRVRSNIFPDTVKEVIYQKSQFSPARSGSLDRALAEYDDGKFTSDMEIECVKAAKEALNGATSITMNGKTKSFSKYLFFSGRIKGYTLQLGNHQFK